MPGRKDNSRNSRQAIVNTHQAVVAISKLLFNMKTFASLHRGEHPDKFTSRLDYVTEMKKSLVALIKTLSLSNHVNL